MTAPPLFVSVPPDGPALRMVLTIAAGALPGSLALLQTAPPALPLKVLLASINDG